MKTKKYSAAQGGRTNMAQLKPYVSSAHYKDGVGGCYIIVDATSLADAKNRIKSLGLVPYRVRVGIGPVNLTILCEQHLNWKNK